MSLLKYAKRLAFFLAAAATCYGQIPVLKFEAASVLFADGAKIEFSTSQTECDQPNAINSMWQGKYFQIYTGSDICRYDQDNQWFRYELFIKKLSSPQQWYHSELKAIPFGRFIDCYKAVTFTIGEGTTKEQGSLRLPLHDLSNNLYLSVMIEQDKEEIALKDAVLNVKLGSDYTLQFNIKNNLHEMPLVVSSAKLSYIQPSLWTSTGPQDFIEANKSKIIPQDQKWKTDPRQIRPRALRAIQSTFFGLKSGNETGLDLIISYFAQRGGNPRELSVPIKVRFVPSLVFLFLAILIGSITGVAGRLLDRKARASISAIFWSFLAALVGAIILELFGIVLVGLNSEFKIFGLALDPFQFPQVLFIAVLVGAFGINILDIIKPMLKLDEGKKKSSAKDGGQGGRI